MINWKSVSPTQFEELCYELLEFNGFKNIEWFGKGGGDKGRDLVASKFDEPLSGVQRQRTWVVQCKRYIDKKITKLDIENFLASAREHSPDVVLLIISNTLSSNIKDWQKTVSSSYGFDIFIWEEKDLEREISIHKSKLRTEIQMEPSPGKATLFYEQNPTSIVYMSSEPDLEEVGFYLLYDYGPEENAKYIKKFIEYIRKNEIEFDVDRESE